MKSSSKWFKGISFLITALVTIIVIIILNFMSRIEHDAQTINELGVIRGSIQRLVKRELNNIPSDTHIKDITKSIDENFFLKDDFNKEDLLDFINKWLELNERINDYRMQPNTQTQDELFLVSEELWTITDHIVLSNQHISQRKIYFLNTIIFLFIAFAIIIFISIMFLKKFVFDRLEILSIYDLLTKLFNRRYFLEYLKNEIYRAERKNKSFCLLMYDIDYFKRINDLFGHSFGDQVLEELSHIIKCSIRKADVLCRYGGEEFVMLLPDTDLKTAYILAERIRRMTEHHNFSKVDNITISIGVASYKKGDTAESIINKVDTAMYTAKNKGRNRVEVDRE